MSVFVNPLERKGDADEIIDFLAEIELGTLRGVRLFEPGFDRDVQLFEAAVTENCYRSLYIRLNFYRSSAVTYCRFYLYVRIEDLLIPEAFKELFSCTLTEMADAGSQIVQIYYKGLQS